MRNSLAAVLATIVITSSVCPAQNAEMQHRDGTFSGISRGGVNTAMAGLYQRYPADQTCGAATIHSFNVLLQDQNPTTAENFTLLIRRNNPTGPATGSPDTSAAGILGGSIFNAVNFGTGTAPVAAFVQVIFPNAGLPLPGGAVPAGDIYVGAELPSTTGTNPAWPADGLAPFINATAGADLGEQFRSTFVGYSGTAGVMGLGWVANLTTNTVNVGTGNRSWVMGLRPAQDVLQPFAQNAAVFVGGTTSGLNPNFGYVGIAPDVVRGDAVGFRLRSNAPVGSAVILGYDAVSGAATNVGLNGLLCLNLATASLFPAPLATTVAGTVPPVGTPHASELIVGPFGGIAGLSGFGNIFVQCGTVDPTATGGIRLSTMARVNF